MISIKFGLKGLNFGMVSACASSANAIADALTYIRAGKADIIIAGGAEACVCESGVGGFNAMKALSTRNESPETASRPFDAERDGFVIGEGAAALVLESLEHALARNAHIYAELAGTGLSADAYHMTATHPDGEGAFRAMKEALADASMSKEEIDYVNAHATSTSHGDLSEMRALSSLFGELEKRPHISATKSMTGHLLGAAGALEAAICVKSIETSMIPPTINTKNIDTELPGGFDLTLDSAASKKIRAAMSNSFGFGGHNATLIFKEYQKEL